MKNKKMNTPNTIRDEKNERIEKFIELLKTNPEAIESQVIKEVYKELLQFTVNLAKDKSSNRQVGLWLLDLLKLDIISTEKLKRSTEFKLQIKELLKVVLQNVKKDYGWLVLFLELIKLDIFNDDELKEFKEESKKLLKPIKKKAKSNPDKVENLGKLIELNIFNDDELKELKKSCKNLLILIIKEAKSNPDKVENLGKLIELNIFNNDELNIFNNDELNIFNNDELKEFKEDIKELLILTIKEAKSNPDKVGNLGILIKSGILSKEELKELEEFKELYKNLLEVTIETVKSNPNKIDNLGKLIELNIFNDDELKELKKSYKELLILTKQKVALDHNPMYIAPGYIKNFRILMRSGILSKEELKEFKEDIKELLNIMVYVIKKDSYAGASLLFEFLKVDIFSEEELKEFKEELKELLEYLLEKGMFDGFYDKRYLIGCFPRLLKLYIMDKREKNIDIEFSKNITLIGTIFLEKNKNRIDRDDIFFINRIDTYFTNEEINYLYKQKYEYFNEIENIIEEGDYQKIWGIKKEAYPQIEKEKLKKLEDHFGEGVWTYFVDKVPGNKTIKNRFRDPHNALLRNNNIIELAEQLETKGISKEKFIKNYLGVAGDRNNGYQQLNNFLEKYKSNWKELIKSELEDENGLKNNPEFVEYVNNLLEKERTGALYKNLDEFENVLTVLNMINQKQSLIKLQKLSESTDSKDKKLYEYYKSAIFHPRTNSIIMEMYKKPREFLGLDDTTFSDLKTIHQAKKPSNMVENFKFLDFDAKDLVDCLPLGIYDQLSYFKPFEMKFFINGSDVFTKKEIQQKISEFLSGADQKKITNIIKKLKENGDEIMWYQVRKNNKETFIDELMTKYAPTDLINLFTGLGYCEFNKYKDLREMTAKISPKSDPNNWFNGFYCDSLAEGHGKKVVAMFNPYCTDFCIYEGDQDPEEDNLKVTSWVTLNRAIPEKFTTLLDKLLDKVKSETTYDIVSVLGDKFEDCKDPNEYVITMDNIEANPNFGSKNELAVRKMYEKFFSEYVRQNPISPNGIPINTHKFYSGVNYNKLNILTDDEDNMSLPVFVNAYTDNSASKSLKGNLDAGEQRKKVGKRGIWPLSIEDVIQISYMEGKIYPSSMKDHLGNLQHEITASILNNTLKGRPNLSFVWYYGEGKNGGEQGKIGGEQGEIGGEQGKIGGYILAYQGKMKDGTPGIYISDFAMDEKNRKMGGGKLVYYRIKHVKKYYPDMPIFTRARENTSYRLIKDEKTEGYRKPEKYGYRVVQDEVIKDGGENFHWVVMEPKK